MMTPISSSSVSVSVNSSRAASPSAAAGAHPQRSSFLPRGMVCRMMFAVAALVCVQVIPQTRLSYRKMLRAESDLNRSLMMHQQNNEQPNIRSTLTQQQTTSHVAGDRPHQTPGDNLPVTTNATSVQNNESSSTEHDGDDDEEKNTTIEQIQSDADENESPAATSSTDADNSQEAQQQSQLLSVQEHDESSQQDGQKHPANVVDRSNDQGTTEEEQQPAQPDEPQATEKKPRFVLHFGPMKTGQY